MDTKLRQRSIMTAATSSSNYFPIRTGYGSIFSHNLLQPSHSSVINRGFATASPKSLPYLNVNVAHDSPLAGTTQGQTKMGGLVSLIKTLPIVGVVQNIISNFLFPSAKEATATEKVEKTEDCTTTKDPIPEKSLLSESPISTFIKSHFCDTTTCDNCGESPKSKRSPRNALFLGVNGLCTTPRPHHSPFNPHNFYHKCRMGDKNRLEKQRHNIQCDIHEDLGGIVSSDDDDGDYFDPINDDTHFASFETGCNEIAPKLTVIYKSSPENESSLVSKSFILSMDDFPLIPECSRTKRKWPMGSPKRPNGSCYRRQDSIENGTDEEFVVFDHDSVKTTPSAGTGKSSLKSLLINRLNCGARRRQISECSDDSVVIFFETDGEQQSDCWSDTDLSEAEEADESDEDEDTVDIMDCNQQRDSGFEEHEKKV